MNMMSKNVLPNENDENCSSLDINILLVDDDSDRVTIVSKMLRASGHTVTTAKLGNEALCIFKDKGDELDVVLIEMHLADMDKFKFVESIREMTTKPVVVFSRESIVDMRNPITKDDIETLWRLFITKKESLLSNNCHVESVQESRNNKRKRVEEWSPEGAENGVSKRSRVVWTPELQAKFKLAVHELGIHRATPTKILKHMNVPGLNRKNISSHLQKYKIYLKEKLEELEKTLLEDDTASPVLKNLLAEIHTTPILRNNNNSQVGNPSRRNFGIYGGSPGTMMSAGYYWQQPRWSVTVTELVEILVEGFSRYLVNDTIPWPGAVPVLKAYLSN